MNSLVYNYSQGNRLEDRNTYFYTRYQGVEFMNAWRDARNQALLKEHAHSVVSAEKHLEKPFAEGGIDTQCLLKSLTEHLSSEEFTGETRVWTEALRKRFEISKRVYGAYSVEPPFKAVPDSDWRNLELYAGFSQLMDSAYACTGDIAYLNALLKCNDILVSVTEQLPAESLSALRVLLDGERRHVEELAARMEVTL